MILRDLDVFFTRSKVFCGSLYVIASRKKTKKKPKKKKKLANILSFSKAVLTWLPFVRVVIKLILIAYLRVNRRWSAKMLITLLQRRQYNGHFSRSNV